jgi:Skp family chaperone for outer membrane proteins
MRKFALVLATAAVLAVPATATASIPPVSPAQAVVASDNCTEARGAYLDDLEMAKSDHMNAYKSARTAWLTAKAAAVKAKKQGLKDADSAAARKEVKAAFREAMKSARADRKSAKKEADQAKSDAEKAARTAFGDAKKECRKK